MDLQEYPGSMPACFEKGLPRCPVKAVIPTMTMETTDGIKKLQNTVVHVIQNNATYYVDDKHRITEICSDPVERNNYNFEENPENFRGQLVFDYDNQRGVYYNNRGEIFNLVVDGLSFDSLTNRPKYNGSEMTHATNIPLVPTQLSQLENDSGFITESVVTDDIAAHNVDPTAHADIRQAITDEATARATADNTLDGKITAEETARVAADNALATADSVLDGKITAEATARAAADDTLDGKITTEITDRATADATLQSNINAEATARANADTSLGNRITSEETTRSAADSALAGDISAEVTRAEAAETALGGRIDDEATARAAADTTLDGKITTEATARANADSTLDGKITDEATARANADTALGTRITDETTARTNADTAINNKLNRNVLYDLEMQTDANNVTFVEDKINLGTGATTTERDVIPAASRTTAGTISASEYISLVDAEEKITALLEGAVAIDNLPANPTQAQLTAAWKTATGKDELINRASIYDSANQLVHTYYTNVSEWEDSPAGGQITIDQFTNSAAGIIKGSTTDGNVSANLDGTGTVSGWTALKNTVAGKANSSDLATVATSGSYNDLSNKPTIPTVNNATLTIQKNGTTVKTFTANASTDVTANITVPTKTSDLTNDSNFPVDANYVHTDNNFTTALKNKLDGIAAGAEVNQNAFSNVKVGSTTVAADSKTDTLELVAGSNVTLTPDATNDKVTIAATDTNTTYNFANGTNGFTVTPSGGSAQTVTVTPSIADATTSAHGLMSAADKTKLNGIASGAEVNVQSDWSVTDTSSDAFIKNKPTIPTVNNGTLTIQKNGTNVATFTANQSGNATANITVPTKVTDLTDAANYVAKDGAFYVTGEGSNFSMTGTSQNVYADLKVKGDTQQTTYTGKNLNNGVSQGYFVNVAANGVGKTENDSGLAIAVQANTNYTVSTTKTQARYRVAVLSTLPTSSATVAAYNGINKDDKSESITINSGSYTYLVVNATDLSAVQVEAGSSATAFEPYVGGVPAPNPDYPQEVEVVTGRQVVSSCGKNLIHPKPAGTTSNGIKADYNEATGEIKLSGTATSTWAIPFRAAYLSIPAGTTLRLKQFGTFSTGRLAFHAYYTDGASGEWSVNSSSLQIGFTVPKDVYSYYIAVVGTTNGASVSGSAYLQLEKGSAATTFEPYLGKEYELNLGKNLLDISTLEVGYVAYNDGSIVNSDAAGERHSDFIKVKPSTTYTFTIVKTATTYQSWFGVGEYTTSATSGFIRRDVETTVTAKFITFTTAPNCQYVIVSARNLASATKVQLEESAGPTDYAPYFEPIELCKIGDYQDYIYKSDGKWWLHKATNKISLTGDETWTAWASGGMYRYYTDNYSSQIQGLPQTIDALSSHFDFYGVGSGTLANNKFYFNMSTGTTVANGNITLNDVDLTTVSELKTWLRNNDVLIYCPRVTATDTEITNPLLVAQLDDLWRNLQSGTNTTNVNVEGDLPAILGVTAFTNTLASAMAGINERMNRLPAIPQITMTTTDPGEGQLLADNHFIAVYSN